MTFLKKSVSILLTLAMIFSLGVCAFAVETGDNDVDFGNLGSLLYGDVDDNDIVDILIERYRKRFRFIERVVGNRFVNPVNASFTH